jgi:putative ABC transport system permease protein
LAGDNDNISVRVDASHIPSVIDAIKSRWKVLAAGQPLEYGFMDDQFNRLYNAEQQTGRISISFAVLAIAVACLGLFGLVTFAAEQMTKEIGIRKVLGANVQAIVTMIIADFLKLVIIASIIAIPIAWWSMNNWLDHFVYRVSIGWWVFLISSLLAVLLTLATISYQAIKAALANPSKSLKTD